MCHELICKADDESCGLVVIDGKSGANEYSYADHGPTDEATRNLWLYKHDSLDVHVVSVMTCGRRAVCTCQDFTYRGKAGVLAKPETCCKHISGLLELGLLAPNEPDRDPAEVAEDIQQYAEVVAEECKDLSGDLDDFGRTYNAQLGLQLAALRQTAGGDYADKVEAAMWRDCPW